MESHRLYVGGISEAVLENDLKTKFGEFGRVKSVEIRCKENYGNRRYFAYVDMEADSKAVEKCVHQCNNLQWKDGCLKVQPAKESFLQKTQKEILERKAHADATSGKTASGPSEQRQASQWSGRHKQEHQHEPDSQHSAGRSKRTFKEELSQEPMEVDQQQTDPPKWRSKDSKHRFEGRQQDQTRQHGTSEADDELNLKGSGKRKTWKQDGDDEDHGKDIYHEKDNYHDNKQSYGSGDGNWRSSDRRGPNRFREETDEKGIGAQEFRHRRGYDAPEKQNWSDERSMGGGRGDGHRNSYGEQGHRRHDRNMRGGFGDGGDRRPDKGDGFESQRNDLFEDIDAADELGEVDDDDEVIDLDGDLEENAKGRRRSGAAGEEAEDDPISETQLKKLFDGKETQTFTLSSLFADQLKVEQLPSSDEDEAEMDGGRSAGRRRRDSGADDRFGDEYWRRAEHKGKAHQLSWEEMRRRPQTTSEEQQKMGKLQQSFFLLPGDPRLNEGLEQFQTDADPSQFIDAWAEQAEQLTLRLFQRKTNSRAQRQMAQRLSSSTPGHQKKRMKTSTNTPMHSQVD